MAMRRSARRRRPRDCTAWMASVDRERPRWSGPRLSRGPQVMVARGAGLGVAARGDGVRAACGRKRSDAMGGGEGEQGRARSSGGRMGCVLLRIFTGGLAAV